MLTRLKVTGFKNLVDVDVRFGPFTCIAGANGVGKSNLFDAIRFLSALADKTLLDAALCVRDEEGRTADIRSLFHLAPGAAGKGPSYDPEMTFEAEMIIPERGRDDFGQEANAGITSLRYSLTLRLRDEKSQGMPGGLEIVREELRSIKKSEAEDILRFENKAQWRASIIKGVRRGGPYISTGDENKPGIIEIHQDGKTGRPRKFQASTLPRTLLSSANATETPTALLARREMQSWRLLLMEPSALRRPDKFLDPHKLGADGSHLPATLYRLATHQPDSSDPGANSSFESSNVYARVANRLSSLVDVRKIWIDRDEKRELLTLQVMGSDGSQFNARALSDGTLRFLALAVLAEDPQEQGLLCLEEPENGIHPERIPAILEVLQDIAADVYEPAGPDNPLRQVIINTHSPSVVLQVPDDSLLVAELKDIVRGEVHFKGVTFCCLPRTWRATKAAASEKPSICSKGTLLSYLNPIEPGPIQSDLEEEAESNHGDARPTAESPVRGRVIDRPELRQLHIEYDSCPP